MSFLVGEHLQHTPGEALERCLSGAVILDIRSELLCRYKSFDVPEVLYCPWQEIGDHAGKLPNDREIIVADSSGTHTREVIIALKKTGISNIAGLGGGMVEWERDGLPLILDNHARLSGSCMCQLKFRS